jgi:hypothetical protein
MVGKAITGLAALIVLYQLLSGQLPMAYDSRILAARDLVDLAAVVQLVSTGFFWGDAVRGFMSGPLDVTRILVKSYHYRGKWQPEVFFCKAINWAMVQAKAKSSSAYNQC